MALVDTQYLIERGALVWQQLKTNLLLSKWAERSNHYLHHMPLLVDGRSVSVSRRLSK